MRSTSIGIRTRALTMLGVVALLALSLGAGVVAADSGGNSAAENTFTKYISSYPMMAGVVGGDVGTGVYAGEITALTVTGTGFVIDAVYHFNGSKHSFTALVHIVQIGFTIGATGVITGQVADGWLKGNQVQGEFTAIACTQAPNGTCFQGTLDVIRGSKG